MSPELGFIVVQDASAGIRVHLSGEAYSSLMSHRVEVTGKIGSAEASGSVTDPVIRDLGEAKLPRAGPLSAADLHSAGFDGLRGTLSGVLGSLRLANGGSQFPLNSSGPPAVVYVSGDMTPWRNDLEDAAVDVTGVVFTDLDSSRQVVVSIFLPGRNAIKIVQHPPDPATLPLLTLRQVAALPQLQLHRVHLRGDHPRRPESVPIAFR